MTDTPRSDELLTLGEVAKLLKVTTKRVHELTRNRSQKRSRHPLPVVKIHAKLIRVRQADFDRWISAIAQEYKETGQHVGIKRWGETPRQKSELQTVRDFLKSGVL